MASIQQLNRDLADRILADAARNPHAYPGKFVGVANGQLVVVTNDLDDLGQRLRQADPDPAHRFWFELGRDYKEVHHVWEIL